MLRTAAPFHTSSAVPPMSSVAAGLLRIASATKSNATSGVSQTTGIRRSAASGALIVPMDLAMSTGVAPAGILSSAADTFSRTNAA